MYTCNKLYFPLQHADTFATVLRFSIFLTNRAVGLPIITTADACFAECNYTRQRRLCTRQRAVGISLHGKGFFAECFLSGTRQSLYRVPKKHSVKIYTRQNKNAKKPKNNSKIFQNLFFRGRPPPASARPSSSKSVYFLR